MDKLNQIKLSMVGMTLIFLTGCPVHKQDKAVPDDPRYAPVTAQEIIKPKNNYGSLYQQGFGISLYEDTTARRVGDILTVSLMEEVESKSSATVDVTRNADIDSAVTAILNGKVKYPFEALANAAQTNINTTNKYKGDGESDSSHSLNKGSITVTVYDVLPNGNLMVRGEKWISLNQDKKYVRLTGIVRPDDIDADNTVMSTKIADARIAYNGKGMVSDASEPGFITRFFMSPYFPF